MYFVSSRASSSVRTLAFAPTPCCHVDMVDSIITASGST